MLRNRIIFTLTTLLCFWAYLWTDSGMALAMTVSLLIIAALLFVSVRICAHLSTFAFDCSTSCHVGQDLELSMDVDRGPTLPIGYYRFELQGENTVFRSEWSRTIEPESLWKPHSQQELLLEMDDYGEIVLSADSFKYCDVLGLFNAKIPFTWSQKVTVHPSSVDLVVTMTRAPRARVLGESFTEIRKGNDNSEVFDMRDYEPGDPLQGIHWKLSSKFDHLISREFSKPSSYEVLVVSDNPLAVNGEEQDHRFINAVASVTLSLSEALLREGCNHDIAAVVDGSLSSDVVDGLNALARTLASAIVTPLEAEHDSLSLRLVEWGYTEAYTKVILVTSVFDDASWRKLAAEVDLTVVFVSESSDSSGSMTSDYQIISLDEGRLFGNVHRIDI